MKKMKKIIGLLLSVVMILAMSMTALAAVEVTVGSGDSRTYNVYQIFTGDLSKDNVLVHVKWGANGIETVGTDVDQSILDELSDVNPNASNTEKLAIIEKYVNMNTEAFATVSATKPLTAPTGYYLFEDASTPAQGEAKSLYVVEVVGPTTINPKAGTVESNKKVQDTNDTTGETTSWQDSADYDIGDAVPFRLTGTVPADYANYTSYYYAFHDTESDGLTFNEESVVVKVDNVAITSGYDIVTEGLTDGCTFEVVFADLKDIAAVEAGSIITVEYTSTLNSGAVIGSTGNPNEMYLEYSNNPNTEGEGETGTTPKDKVIVFTYKVVVNKVNEEQEELTGAGFTLSKKNAEGTYVTIGEELIGPALSTFEWAGLDDGEYKLEETTVPSGYNKIEPIEFTITAEHQELADNPMLTSLSGGVLGTGEVSTGQITTTIVNQSGATLPETGGIGTTIFYVVGAILVIGAGVVLITRRRMNNR